MTRPASDKFSHADTQVSYAGKYQHTENSEKYRRVMTGLAHQA